jgi:hypothetical protein
MLGRRKGFDAVPFFWTQQYDLTLSYIAHARQWDRVEIDGSIADRDTTASYRRGVRKLAVLTIWRERDGLATEFQLEKTIAAGGWAGLVPHRPRRRDVPILDTASSVRTGLRLTPRRRR